MTAKMNNVSGVLLLDKSAGVTSNHALQAVKRLYQAKHAGHTGSLDPIATGLLPICFGEATKFSQFLLDADKYYRVTARLGTRTSTGDSEGEVLKQGSAAHIKIADIRQILPQFIGNIMQVPPMFSALKHQGKPLYQLARQGITVPREPRPISVYEFTVLDYNGQDAVFDLHCSKGTYVRTLIDDIGELLGCGAHVHALCRTAVAAYKNLPMYQLDDLIALKNGGGLAALYQLLLPIDSSVANLPEVVLSNSALFYMKMGQAVRVTKAPAVGLVRLVSHDDQRFVGVGEMLDDYRVQPKRLLIKAVSGNLVHSNALA